MRGIYTYVFLDIIFSTSNFQLTIILLDIRFLKTLKDKVKNKARVEASICEAYLVEEATTFASYYYPDERYSSRIRDRVPRNDDGGGESVNEQRILIFNYSGKTMGRSRTQWLDDQDLQALSLYIVQNCEAVTPYLE